jgi:dipeptidyl aminopeptidase/acylaminoacyl peptidase
MALAFSAVAFGQSKRAITFDDLISFGRLSDPQISPDGKAVAFVVTSYSKEENRSSSNVSIVPLAGGPVRQLTNTRGANVNPRWMPDSRTIAFLSNRDGSSQIWTISVDGGEAKRVSSIATEVSGLLLSPDGKWFAFNSEVFPDCADQESNQKRMEALEKSKVKAKIFTRLPYRVWNRWTDGKRSHLFVLPVAGGTLVDLTPGEYDTPPIDLGGSSDYAFSPDSKELVFTRNPDALVAISTNNELYTVPVTGGPATRITDNPANDSQPFYTPDGKYIGYRMMKKPMFEADQRRLAMYDRLTKKRENLTEAIDLSIGDVAPAPDGSTFYFTASDRGRESIFRVTALERKVALVLQNGMCRDLRLSPDGKTLVFLLQTMNKPAELYRVDVDGRNLRALTSVNAERLAGLAMNAAEEFWFPGAGGTNVHGFLLRPPLFDVSRKYPLVFLVHGGPQGEWGDEFHYRWNAQMFASRGFVVVMINPRGSTGYGQRFTDEISRDWGGKVYEDLMNGLEYALRAYRFIDITRMAAAGASYGGYMMNWILGHTDRFKCVVSHDGVFNPVSMYGSTEEVWFPEWEFGGTPYDNPDLYRKWSPVEFAKYFKTPTLVVHGQLDYRVDVSEGFQLFTALQRQGVESKMLYFPDEGHFVAKPQNSELWYRTVLDWISDHTK